MADITFKIPERFNMDLAEKGVDFRVEDITEDYYGTFTCRHVDLDSPAYKQRIERINQDWSRGNRNRKITDDEIKKEIMIRAVLVGWKDIVDGEDKPVPFNEKNARAYFNSRFTKFVLNELFERASDPLNFKLSNKREALGN